MKSSKAETVPPKLKNPSHQEVSIPKAYDDCQILKTSRLLFRRQRDLFEARRLAWGFLEERRSCTSGGEEREGHLEDHGGWARAEVWQVAVQHQLRITGAPGQLPFIVFIPHLTSTSASSLGAAISSGFHHISKSSSPELCTL